MEINDKKIKRTSKIINFIISSVLAIFLILLSNSIIYDLDSAVTHPDQNEYVNNETKDSLGRINTLLRDDIRVLEEQRDNFEKMHQVSLQTKRAEQESFDNWIKTRSTLGDPNQDTQVLNRVKKLDQLQQIAQGWNLKADSINTLINKLEITRTANLDLSNNNWQESYQEYQAAVNKYDIKVFFIRLLFVAPILALGIFFFIRKRKHKFSPLFMGFTLFSVYAFFVGLVPYFPSFGGYIRYTVGIFLTIGLGYYAIKRIRAYTDQKQAELKESSTKRATKLQVDITEKAFNNHVCPSCGKDFLLKSWERVTDIDTKTLRPTSHFCRHCGMQLFKKCGSCQQENYAHLPFCVSCGVRINQNAETIEE